MLMSIIHVPRLEPWSSRCAPNSGEDGVDALGVGNSLWRVGNLAKVDENSNMLQGIIGDLPNI
eukprot:1331062-Amorphochlora_amoeboformis.AAC.1